MLSLRVCLVTPFAWSQPHDVNDHVAGVARELRGLGHTVTVLAPSTRARDLREGRRALQRGGLGDFVAIGPALPVSRRSTMATPVGVRANLALALAQGRFDIVHGFEPGLPSLSYLALRDAEALAVATFFSPERLFYPPGKAQRARLLGRIDALLATSEETAEAAAERFPGDYTVISPGVDLALFVRPGRDGTSSWSSSRASAKPRVTRFAASTGRTVGKSCSYGRAPSPAGRTSRCDCAAASTFERSPRRKSEPRSSTRRASSSPRQEEANGSPSKLPRPPVTAHRPTASQRWPASSIGCTAAWPAGDVRSTSTATRSPTANGSSATSIPTRRGRMTAASPPQAVLDAAEEIGLGAVAVTDHNVFGGALEAVELARGRDLIVIPGEEVKTKGQGEVIGLFLQEEIPRGMSFEDTLAAIREQGGLVFLPHPFDRRHAIPDPQTLHRHLAEIDVLEVYNARLLMETYNDEALRFARKYNVLQGAGSDAHVLPGLGTGGVRMREFRTPEEFLISLHTAEILRRPKSLAYLQSLKWVAQVKEKVALDEKVLGLNVAVPTDEIYEKYLQKAIREINDLGDEITRAAGDRAVPVLGSGHPMADIMLLKYGPQGPEIEEGVAYYGRAGQAVLRSLQRLRVDPMAVYGTNCLKFEGAEPDGRSREWLARELHIVQPKLIVCMGEDALGFLNGLAFPLAQEAEPRMGELQPFTPTIEVLACPDIDASLDDEALKKTFWSAFKPVGSWWAELPPY